MSPLTKFERLSLINQFKILAATKTKNSPDYDAWIAILRGGFTSQYNSIVADISDELSASDQDFVQRVLRMSMQLEDCIAKAKLKNGPAFFGFDDTGEVRLLVYAEFLMDGEHEYGAIKRRRESKSFKSPGPMSDRYLRMLAAWRDPDSGILSPEDVTTIFAAAVHPDDR